MPATNLPAVLCDKHCVTQVRRISTLSSRHRHLYATACQLPFHFSLLTCMRFGSGSAPRTYVLHPRMRTHHFPRSAYAFRACLLPTNSFLSSFYSLRQHLLPFLLHCRQQTAGGLAAVPALLYVPGFICTHYSITCSTFAYILPFIVPAAAITISYSLISFSLH